MSRPQKLSHMKAFFSAALLVVLSAHGSSAPAARVPSNGEPDVYVTPAPSSSPGIAPPARLANYVVAHSEYSGPLSRRMALLGLVAADSDVEVPAEENAAAKGDAAAGAADGP